MKPDRAPARPHMIRDLNPGVADLGVEPSIQAYETQSGSGPSAMRLNQSGDGGIRTHTVHVLSVATPTRWSTSPFSARNLEHFSARNSEREMQNEDLLKLFVFWVPSSEFRTRLTRGGIEPPFAG